MTAWFSEITLITPVQTQTDTHVRHTAGPAPDGKCTLYTINILRLILSYWQLLEDTQYELTKFKSPVSWEAAFIYVPESESQETSVQSVLSGTIVLAQQSRNVGISLEGSKQQANNGLSWNFGQFLFSPQQRAADLPKGNDSATVFKFHVWQFLSAFTCQW